MGKASVNYSYSRVCLLDTNAIHYARLYLDLAKQWHITPCGIDPSDFSGRLMEQFGKKGGYAYDSYTSGEAIVRHLIELTRVGGAAKYASITQLELVCGSLRGEAILHAAKDSTPFRMWSRIDEFEILHRLGETEYSKIQKTSENLSLLFDGAGINLTKLSTETERDVWAMASSLLGVVYLEIGDSIVYAAALLELADDLITADGYLRKVAAGLENPGSAPQSMQEHFKGARAKIDQVLMNALGINISEVRLPKAILPKTKGQPAPAAEP